MFYPVFGYLKDKAAEIYGVDRCRASVLPSAKYCFKDSERQS